MPSAKRVKLVIDTNVLISILIGKSLGRLRPMLRSGQVQLVLSPMLLDEFKLVVSRPHLRAYFDPDAVARFVRLIERTGVMVKDTSIKTAISRDPKDDYLLVLASSGAADMLVTGDKDLLSIGVFKGVRIIAPSKLMEELSGRL